MSAATGIPRLAAQPIREERPSRLRGLGMTVLVLTLIPYLCGYLLSPPGKSFLGALNNVGDLSQYLAAIRQGAHGAWRYSNQFTPDHARPLVMYSPYLLAGHISFGAPAAIVFQVLRLVCAAAALTALARFCRLFIGPYTLRTAWLLVLLAGGLYWFALPLSAFVPHLVNPTALTAPELSPLLTLLISPHESLGLAAELTGFLCILRASGATEPLWSESRARAATSRDTSKLVLGAAASFLVLALSYPFLLPTVGLVLFAYALIAARVAQHSRLGGAMRKRQLKASEVFITEMRAIVLALAPASLIGLYYLFIFRRDPLWSHSGIAQVGRPDIGVMIFAFGPLAVFAFLGVRQLRESRPPAHHALSAAWIWFPLAWALVNAGTLLLPIWQQGRQALGFGVPLALLSFVALAGPRAVAGRDRTHLPPLPATVLAFASPLLLALYTAITAGGVNNGYYAPSGVIQGVTWLGSHARSGDVVLASAGFGNLVPEDCSCRVVIGQNFQSFDWATRQAEVYDFYAAPSLHAARAALVHIIQREHVTYVVYSPFERDIGHSELRQIAGFTERYDRNGVVIFASGRAGR